MKKITDQIRYFAQLLLYPVFLLSALFPRDKKLWVFGSTFGRRFADNPRYLFLYASSLAKETGINCVWITRDRAVASLLERQGLKVCLYPSLKAYLTCLRAGVYIYDNYSKDISFPLSGGALRVNLWHGVGNKRINHDNIHDRFRNPRNPAERLYAIPRTISDEKPEDYVLCTSAEMGRYFARAFRCSGDHVLCEGYPRCDALFARNASRLLGVMTGDEKRLVRELVNRKRKGSRILLYLPTFRESEEMLEDVMDWETFGAWLKDRDYVFAAKPHPKSKAVGILEKAACKEENVLLIPAEADVYTFLGLGDMLVTDYSSVYTDYMLLERPVAAFIYDSREYEINSRDYFIDQRQYMPELCAETMEELMEVTDSVMEKDEKLEDRLRSRERLFDIADGGACGRVYERIRRLADDKS